MTSTASARQARLELGATQSGAPLGERAFDRVADRVGDRADLRAIVGRQRADPAQHGREPALLAEDVELERFERGDIRGGRDRRERLRLEGLQVAGQVGEVHAFLRISSPRSSRDVEGSKRLQVVDTGF